MSGLHGQSVTDRLAAAVITHSGLERDQIIEAARVGADKGWSGFIYNIEAAAFFDQHDELIWDHLTQLADDLGEPNAAALIASFGRADMMHSYQGFKVLLAWFALEEAGRTLDQD